MKEVHFIAQGKGGVGKSTIAGFLGDYLKAKSDEELHCYDTDPVNQTFSRYAALEPEVVKILTDANNIDARFFDGLIEKLVNDEGIAVIDNGAATFVPLMSYMAENEVPAFLAENGIRMIIHVPLAGGQSLQDCMTGLSQTLNSNSAEIVVWLNDFHGVIEKDGKGFTDFKVYQANRERIIGIVHIPNRNPDTFGADIKEMTTKNLTLTEAQNSGVFGLMPRQRLRTVQRDLYGQLDKIPFLATQAEHVKNVKQSGQGA
ncbi:conjugal transfer protein TraL [Neisseria chenwenguii]|uniref:Conjugal transfer protein TraL n=1 Tax=Neisseria chenwenguii TaxID=1853278 RepID=A0A220S0W2_9NEIS|nr:conjugal transfer protein TraL [Neisseria chenwenguii]ASK27130.1 conjugal transfer protein TraL [Neisseria chenwenguii]